MRKLDDHIVSLLTLAALAGLALAGPAHGATPCDKAGQTVVAVMAKEKVAVYDAAGNIRGTLDKHRIVTNEPILECRNDPQLVRVRITDGALGEKAPGESAPSVWVDRLEVKISGTEPRVARPCKVAPPSAANDRKTPAVSGIDACSG